ncbi:MAG TPA: hypothetical protein VKN99_10725 [Polyangia bacterium]|nr:hypothetical protein [Polyangia bacterium]
MVNDELDLETRELCPDGACIGVIGPDGRCGECGRTRAEAEAEGAPFSAGADLYGDDDAGDAAGGAAAGAADDAAGLDEDRELCPDGACIGVIGPDGRCRECGRSRA